jgi:hypothetical protein
MAPQPEQLPKWASYDLPGQITEPSSGKKQSGFLSGERPPFQWLNWLLNLVCRWVAYLFSAKAASSTLGVLATRAWRAVAAAEANAWQAVCWSPELGLFVAVSSAGDHRVMTSPTGLVWTGQDHVADMQAWQSVAWCGAIGLFVAVSTNTVQDYQIMTSPDGEVWTGRAADEANPLFVVAASEELGLFVAFSSTGTNRVQVSSDGINWEAHPIPGASVRGVCWSPELEIFVAVANVGPNFVLTSADGITWEPQTAAEGFIDWRSVCWSPELGLFVAVAATGTNRVQTSPDGETWTPRSAAEANAWTAVVWSSELGLFVAVSETGTNRIMTSPDGLTWTAVPAAEANAWTGIAYSPERCLFAAVADDGTNRVMTSI